MELPIFIINNILHMFSVVQARDLVIAPGSHCDSFVQVRHSYRYTIHTSKSFVYIIFLHNIFLHHSQMYISNKLQEIKFLACLQVSVVPNMQQMPECRTKLVRNTGSPVYDEIFSL